MKAFAATFTTIALAVTSLSAQAQSSVQLTGTIDSYAGSMKLAGQERVASVGSGGLTTSWWGVKGVEDLGGGLKADFNITSFFVPIPVLLVALMPTPFSRVMPMWVWLAALVV